MPSTTKAHAQLQQLQQQQQRIMVSHAGPPIQRTNDGARVVPHACQVSPHSTSSGPSNQPSDHPRTHRGELARRTIYGTGMGVTKAPFVNFSVSKIFVVAKVPLRLFESHLYLTGATAAELRRHLSNINAIFDR